MAKIVFIVPSTSRMTRFDVWQSTVMKVIFGENKMFLPSLSGMIIAALTPEKHTFTYIDEEIEDVDFGIDVDIVLITSMTHQSPRAYQIAGEFRKRGKTVILGGIHASVMKEEAMSHFDALILGEAEHSYPALLEDYERGALKSIYDKNDYPPVDKLISPRVDVIKHDKYTNYPIQVTRGCPYDCDFCSIKHSSGHRYRMKPIEQVVNEILEYEKYNHSGYRHKGYYFVDDNFYVNKKYVKELLTALIPLNIKWDAQGTANIAEDEEVVQLMQASGCRSYGIGFESIDSENLQETNKPTVNSVDKYEKVLFNLAKHGIGTTGFFMVGFDGDDMDVFRKTLDFIQRSYILSPMLGILTPYPGTRVYDRLKDRIFNTSFVFYNSWTAVLTPPNMTASELQFGAVWLAREMNDLKLLRKKLKKFWQLGPWERNPALTFEERVVLIFLGIKLGLNGLKEYRSFLIWAALQKKATDLQTIIWLIRRHEVANSVKSTWEPPELTV